MVVSDSSEDTNTNATVSASGRNSWRLYLYLAPLVLVPILIVVAAILIVPTDWFAMHSRNPFLVTLGYGAKLHNADCQIVVYGDSTAMIGLNPGLIRQRTGLNTCNIAETEGMTMLNGTMVLDQYLEHNPRPRFLVFMYSPEALDPQSQRKNPAVTTFEAVTFRFRQPDKLESFFALMKHPDDVLSWATHGVRIAMNGVFAKPLPPETRLLRFKSFGQSALNDHNMIGCNYPHQNYPPNKPWVNSLRSKYSSMGITVIVDSVLLPECDPDIDFFRQELAGVTDNPIDTLPVADYYNGGRHVNPAGTTPLSIMVANQIASRIGGSAMTAIH